MPCTRHHVPAIVAVGVVEHPRTPVFARRHGHDHPLLRRVAVQHRGLPPLQFRHTAESDFLYQIAHTHGHDRLRCHSGQPLRMAHDLA